MSENDLIGLNECRKALQRIASGASVSGLTGVHDPNSPLYRELIAVRDLAAAVLSGEDVEGFLKRRIEAEVAASLAMITENKAKT